MKRKFILLILSILSFNWSTQTIFDNKNIIITKELTPEMKSMADSMFKALQDVITESIVKPRNLLLSDKKRKKYIKQKEIKMVYERKKSKFN